MGFVIAATLALALVFAMPIGMSLGVAAVAGILWLSPDFLIIFPQRVLAGFDSFPLLAIPLFILAGTIMGRGGIAARIVNLAMLFIGKIRGAMGLALGAIEVEGGAEALSLRRHPDLGDLVR